jgi:DNA-binding transcriptional regulator GbsR (MarR family)
MILEMPLELTHYKLKLIEELGVLHEKGMQPAAARILALMLVSDQPELTFEDIHETLNLSKSATSNALNFLISTNKAEYITKPGERRRYFRCKLRSLNDGIQESLAGLDEYNNLLKKILAQRPAETKEFNASLEETTQFLDFIKSELPVLFQKWKSRNK